MADASAVPAASPTADVRPAAAATAQPSETTKAAESERKPPSRVKFTAASFKLEAPSVRRGTTGTTAQVAVNPAQAAVGASARAQADRELAGALTSMGQMASAAVPTSDVRASAPSLRAITSTSTDAAPSDAPGQAARQPDRVKFKPSGVALESAKPRKRSSESGGTVVVAPSRVTGAASAHAGVESELAGALKTVGEMARADIPTRGIRSGNPALRAMSHSAEEDGPGEIPGRPERSRNRVKFKPSAAGLEAPTPRRRGGTEAGAEVAVAPIQAGGGGSARARADSRVARTLDSTAEMSQPGLPDARVSAVRGVKEGRIEDASLPRLSGLGRLVSRKMPPLRVGKDVVLEGPGEKPSNYMKLRDKNARAALLPKLGTSKASEAGVKRALDWFTRHQESDGRWSCRKQGGQDAHDNAATAFAVLCYYGWGVKHTEKGGQDAAFQEPLRKAVTWLASRVGRDGDLSAGVPNGMYDQGIATMALAEAYGLTQDETLRGPLERAVGFIIRAQSTRHGGWRYKSGSGDGDTSVVGWQVMALTSARMAGIDVPEEAFDRAKGWFNRVATGRHKGRYGYTAKGAKHAMTAEAMFCQQLLGRPPSDPRMKESAAFIKTKMPAGGKPNYYYWYYGCLSLYQHQGPIWEEWNGKMRPILLKQQVKAGRHAGSWPANGIYGKQGGRVVSTAMATLSLEVYYRYLPMYGLSAIPAVKRPDANDGGGE